MNTTARFAAGATVVLAPVTAGAADLLRMRAENANEFGLVSESGQEEMAVMLLNVRENVAMYETASWLALVAAFLTIPATIVLWHLAVRQSRRWGWAGAVLGTFSAVGQFVHLMGYFALIQVLAGQADLSAAATIMVDADSNGFALALFVPYLLGVLFAPAVQAVALRRAKVLPTWALISVLVGAIVMIVAGSTPISSVVWVAALVLGFLPAAVSVTRRAGHEAGATLPTPAAI